MSRGASLKHLLFTQVEAECQLPLDLLARHFSQLAERALIRTPFSYRVSTAVKLRRSCLQSPLRGGADSNNAATRGNNALRLVWPVLYCLAVWLGLIASARPLPTSCSEFGSLRTHPALPLYTGSIKLLFSNAVQVSLRVFGPLSHIRIGFEE